MDSAPLNIFQNQVVPIGLHDVSKSFRPNLATPGVFSMGTEFIPVWKKVKIYKHFSKFQNFRRRMTKKMFFEEQYKDIDEFCCKIQAGIAGLVDAKTS